MNFFEQELRRLFGDETIIKSLSFAGTTCWGWLNDDLRVKAQFTCADMGTYNLVAGTLVADGQEIELTKTELKIIYYLFEHPGEIVPRLDLVEYLWDNEIHIDDNTLSVNIMRIREKLRSLGKGELIQTKRGMGYRV